MLPTNKTVQVLGNAHLDEDDIVPSGGHHSMNDLSHIPLPGKQTCKFVLSDNTIAEKKSKT